MRHSVLFAFLMTMFISVTSMAAPVTPRQDTSSHGRTMEIRMNLTRDVKTDKGVLSDTVAHDIVLTSPRISQGHPATLPLELYAELPYERSCTTSKDSASKTTQTCEKAFYQEGLAGTVHLFQRENGRIDGVIDGFYSHRLNEELFTFNNTTTKLPQLETVQWKGAFQEGQTIIGIGDYTVTITMFESNSANPQNEE